MEDLVIEMDGNLGIRSESDVFSGRRVLVVDDQADVRDTLRQMMRELGCEVECASDGIEALAKLPLNYDLLLMDLQMPNMDGYEAVARIRKIPEYAELPIIMVTAHDTGRERIRAVESGANDFIGKPVNLFELKARAASMLKLKMALDELKSTNRRLQMMVEERTSALRKAIEQLAHSQRSLQDAYHDILTRLATAAEYKDQHTADHIYRMSRISGLLAEKLGLPPGQVEQIRHASAMHDVGKIGIPDDILLKPARLSQHEWDVMRRHTTIGGHLLANSESTLLKVGQVIALSHHEKWDGSGYPNGLQGESIPIEGRICAVADVFDALISRRPYKDSFPNERARELIHTGSGSHFDPNIVDVFDDCFNIILDIQREVPAQPPYGVSAPRRR